ncbi:MAG: hypothetical protein IT580_19190, partial [Verrucomicrobiales bacterium]|nr:hypothetical protein [Verrucomicrobiales bacterium]
MAFSTDIQPLLERACLKCHGAERPKAGYRLDSPALAVSSGDNAPSIIAGDSARSRLIHFVARQVEDMEMPPLGKGEPLTPQEIGILRAWIDQGARGDAAASGPTVTASVTTAVQFFAVSGNEGRFREHYGLREGWGGGLSEFSLKYELDPRTRAEISGRALSASGDYRFSARVERDQLGWVRLDYREFARFSDDTGGYYAPFALAAPSLADDLVIRHRHATLETGLELPDWPRLRLAYDLHWRDGSEATLNWGGLAVGGLQRNVFPGRRQVEEDTHQITLDLRHDWRGLTISDLAQLEWHTQDQLRTELPTASLPFDFGTRTRDEQDYWRASNVLRLERNVRDWLYLSAGYLYSRLKDAGGFSLESFVPSDPSTPPSLDVAAGDISIRRQSHVANGNLMAGPWNDLLLHAGVQAEWTRQESFALGRAYLTPTAFDSNLDRAATDETVGLRYTGIPSTVLFAETRFQQETYSQFEEGLSDGTPSFLRDSEDDGSLWDAEAGFTVSPWKAISLQAKYRHRDRENEYSHLRDLDLLGSGNGYPAFIRARDTVTDELDTRLVLQPLRWLKATFRYALASTDFRTLTDGWSDTSVDPPLFNPGAETRSGEYDAHTLGGAFVLTPWSRLHLSTSATWTTSRSLSGARNGEEIIPYEGQTWNWLNQATLVLDEKTDLLSTYLFSTGDFEQDNAAAGLPLGVRYTRHAATA